MFSQRDGQDVHAAGDDVEAAGLQAGDQPAPFGLHRLDLVVAHLRQHAERLGVDEALRAAVVAGIGERDFVGKTDADRLAGVDPVHQRAGSGQRLRSGRARAPAAASRVGDVTSSYGILHVGFLLTV